MIAHLANAKLKSVLTSIKQTLTMKSVLHESSQIWKVKDGKYVHIIKLNLGFHGEHTLGKYRRNIEKKVSRKRVRNYALMTNGLCDSDDNAWSLQGGFILLSYCH